MTNRASHTDVWHSGGNAPLIFLRDKLRITHTDMWHSGGNAPRIFSVTNWESHTQMCGTAEVTLHAFFTVTNWESHTQTCSTVEVTLHAFFPVTNWESHTQTHHTHTHTDVWHSGGNVPCLFFCDKLWITHTQTCGTVEVMLHALLSLPTDEGE
jgi:hypothetical protein